MSNYCEKQLPFGRPASLEQSRLIFRRMNKAVEDVIMVSTYLRMAEKGCGEIDLAALPAMCRLLERVCNSLTASATLLCPQIDPVEAHEQEKMALHPEFDEYAA